MVTVALTFPDGFAVEEAVIVVVPPAGIVAGAVKVVLPPLAVCVGLKDPHSPAVWQVAFQSTPALAVSPVTVALKTTGVLTGRFEGGAVSNARVIPAAAMVITAVAVAVGSNVDVAVSVTVFPDGTALGAV